MLIGRHGHVVKRGQYMDSPLPIGILDINHFSIKQSVQQITFSIVFRIALILFHIGISMLPIIQLFPINQEIHQLVLFLPVLLLNYHSMSTLLKRKNALQPVLESSLIN